MVYNVDVARETARALLKIQAIELESQKPFTWTSGLQAPIYCDNRKALSYPDVRHDIKSQLASLIQQEWPQTEMIAGVATAGIAHGALVADHLQLPFSYVRSEKKEHGLNNQIEGVVNKQKMETVVVEDLISTGNSSLKAVSALHQAGCKVNGVVAIFDYAFPETMSTFDKYHIPLFTLTDYDTLLVEAEKNQYVGADELATLREWRINPQEWGKGS